MSKKVFFGLFFFAGIIFIFFFKVPFFLKTTFLINFLFYYLLSFYSSFFEKEFSPFISVYVVFGILFFIVSPIVQINAIFEESSGVHRFPQNFPFYDAICLRANALIFIFNIIFFYFYIKFKKYFLRFNEKQVVYKNTPTFLLLLAIACFVLVVFNVGSIIFQYQNSYYEENEATSVSNYLITQKFLYVLPISGLILSSNYLAIKTKIAANYKYVYLFFLFFLFLVFFLKNPLTEKRNALGPLYIALIFVFFKNYLSNNFKVFKFMFISMIVFFPLVSVFTHARFSISEMLKKPSLISKTFKQISLFDGFSSLHYDAYANFLATIDYCDCRVVEYGKQMLCSVFFFVPRSIWESKPQTTGFMIGNYLMDKYKFTFNNLSNPFISEGYINFGYFGIFIFAVVLAFVFIKMINWLKSSDVLKSFFAFYFSIYMIFFLRGDLTNGIAFLFSFWMAIYVVPKFGFLLINHYAAKTKAS
jgi:hypothetical protein